MAHIEITLLGIGVVKSLILWSLLFDDPEFNDVRINNIMVSHDINLDNKEVREMLSWVVNDHFTRETLKREKNGFYLKKLESLKNEFYDFYLKHLNELKLESELNTVWYVHKKIEEYAIKIMRLRMVVEPEVQISENEHTQTKNHYYIAKAFWLNDKGEKERKFTKSLGRKENYKIENNNLKSLRPIAIQKLQGVMYETYLKDHPN